MTNRYEDTTPFERDVKTSVGYHRKGEGRQKASDNGGTMVVTGWTGDSRINRQADYFISSIFIKRVPSFGVRLAGH